MCTLEKRGNIFFLTLTGNNEHWLNPTVIDSILSTLREIRSQATRGSVLITTSQGKFFSNGFDIVYAKAAGSASKAMERLRHMVDSFRPVAAEMISLPMPTVAAIQGHAAAAGFLFALCHDYVLVRSDRGVLYMSEVDLGLTMPDYFAAVFRSKINSVSARRDILLRGAKVKGEQAVKIGIAEAAYDGEGSLAEAALRLGNQLAARKWNGDAYKEIRKSLYPDICSTLGVAEEKVASKL